MVAVTVAVAVAVALGIAPPRHEKLCEFGLCLGIFPIHISNSYWYLYLYSLLLLLHLVAAAAAAAATSVGLLNATAAKKWTLRNGSHRLCSRYLIRVFSTQNKRCLFLL